MQTARLHWTTPDGVEHRAALVATEPDMDALRAHLRGATFPTRTTWWEGTRSDPIGGTKAPLPCPAEPAPEAC